MTSRTSTTLVRATRWDGREIRYTIAFAQRRRLSITVHPDLRVEVVAPAGHSVEEVTRRVVARRAWIARQLRELEPHNPAPAAPRWVSGETHWYLGRQYRLRVHSDANARAEVWRAGGRLHVRVGPGEDASRIEAIVRAWYAARAKEVFRARLAHVRQAQPRFAPLRPGLRVLWMRRRWGSCSARGTVSLNVDLVRAPVACVDYVIVHELCHLIVPSHSPRFHRLLAACCPDWQRRRDWLNHPRL